MVSHDNGERWSAARPVATTREESDHPIPLSDGARAFLSWQTRQDGYRPCSSDQTAR
jgi:hypothetical protein